ncbi:MAG TPA: hypothetical protein VJ302_08010 [Blastocatellia bacterium]|nr:hypothetical protein [Blastocatellia bacterium]
MVWLKFFVLLRLPLSLLALIGFCAVLGVVSQTTVVPTGVLLLIVGLILVTRISINLIHHRKSGWWLNWGLMAAEILGLGGMGLAGSYLDSGRIEWPAVLVVVGMVLGVWSMPNAVYLWRRRESFHD